jgi:hypothetical protein
MEEIATYLFVLPSVDVSKCRVLRSQMVVRCECGGCAVSNTNRILAAVNYSG